MGISPQSNPLNCPLKSPVFYLGIRQIELPETIQLAQPLRLLSSYNKMVHVLPTRLWVGQPLGLERIAQDRSRGRWVWVMKGVFQNKCWLPADVWNCLFSQALHWCSELSLISSPVISDAVALRQWWIWVRQPECKALCSLYKAQPLASSPTLSLDWWGLWTETRPEVSVWLK